jgi:hypothetical protein
LKNDQQSQKYIHRSANRNLRLLNNRLFLKKMTEIIRRDLIKKGLKENTANPDVLISFSISTRDYSTVEGQRGY